MDNQIDNIRRVVVHVGAHKTATTAIQKSLKYVLDHEVGAQVEYVDHLSMRQDGVTNAIVELDHARLTELLSGRIRTDKEMLLLSDENIAGSTHDIFRGILYPDLVNRIEFLTKYFKYSYIDFVFCIREPAEFVASMYCEHLRHNHFLEFSSYIKKFDIKKFSWREVLKPIRSVKSAKIQFHIYPFEKKLGGGVEYGLRRILELVDISQVDEALIRQLLSEPVNRSFSELEVDVLRHIARREGGFAAWQVGRALEGGGVRFGSHPFRPLSKRVLNRLSENYERDCRILFG